MSCTTDSSLSSHCACKLTRNVVAEKDGTLDAVDDMSLHYVDAQFTELRHATLAAPRGVVATQACYDRFGSQFNDCCNEDEICSIRSDGNGNWGVPERPNDRYCVSRRSANEHTVRKSCNVLSINHRIHPQTGSRL